MNLYRNYCNVGMWCYPIMSLGILQQATTKIALPASQHTHSHAHPGVRLSALGLPIDT